MRKIIIILLVICLLAGCHDLEPQQASRHVEISQASYDITLLLENASISAIKVENYQGNVDDQEAIAKIIEDIIGSQTINVSAIAGHEEVSQSIMDNVALLLDELAIDPSLFINAEHVVDEKEKEHSYDDIVVGAGVAGLSAAIRLAQKGHKVLLLEKMPYAGGATYLSGGEIAVPMLDNESLDPQAAFLQDMYAGSSYTADLAKLEKIAYNMDEVYQWLQEDIDVEFHDVPYGVNEHSVDRINLPLERGKGLIEKMLAKANALKVDIIYNSEATSLLYANERVQGVNVLNAKEEKATYLAKDKVVLATGGFAYNKELLLANNTQWENLAELNSTVPSGSTGDGILMGMAVGADVIDMDKIQIYPFTNPATGVNHYLDNVRTLNGAIWVNKDGERFVDEQASRQVLSQAILKQPEQTVYQVFNQRIYDATLGFSHIQETYEAALEQGVLFYCEELSACCLAAGISQKLVEEYTESGPYYVLLGKPSIHYTMGGLKTNERSQVLDKKGEVIVGLYAIGEVVGGTFGENRLGATSIDDALVNGYMIE
ncbi:MAG: FAD-dependent oxidoreductase [Erysipelotrichaceae bacterium]|nr:FAD-dependent oxidoreductase [Erysipelotrichaceae bacterium]MDY5251237.1 FAD-dependent oxidoreductase [Erysipelotrichaceae bacterium]